MTLHSLGLGGILYPYGWEAMNAANEQAFRQQMDWWRSRPDLADRFGPWDRARLADLGRRIEAAKARRT